jgi:hypothetical protein
MTRDDIMRMARETDCLDDQHYGSVWADQLERFAKLVAAAEREECAKVVEQAGIDGYGTLAAALLVRERGAP